MKQEPDTVAIVEDDDLVQSAMASLVRSLGLKAACFSSAEAFLNATPDNVGCIISDVEMGAMSGLDLQEELIGRDIRIPMIVMSAFPSDWVRERALANGAHCFLSKPCNPDFIVDCLSEILGLPAD